MDGRKQGQRLLIAHIVGYHHGLLAEGAVDGEGGVQHDTCFSGPVNILVGIADGDRSHGMGEAASHTTDTKGHRHRQRHHLQNVIARPSSLSLCHSDRGYRPEQLPQRPRHHACQNHEIPVHHKLLGKDLGHIACPLMTELSEDGGRGAFAGKGEIHAVDEVGVDRHGITDHIDPSHHLVIGGTLFPM